MREKMPDRAALRQASATADRQGDSGGPGVTVGGSPFDKLPPRRTGRVTEEARPFDNPESYRDRVTVEPGSRVCYAAILFFLFAQHD